jgi:hypothetical protein
MTAPRKFRVWDGEEMHEPPHGFVLGSQGEVIWEPFESNRRELDGHEVLFSTGLTDATQVDIYEGDIIDHSCSEQLDVVEWGNWYPGFDLRHVVAHAVPYALKNGSVVGNRCEDPSLLEQT